MILRPYQDRAVADVRAAWAQGARSVCLVAPCGAGKTVLGTSLVGSDRCLWICHTRELLDQTRARLPWAAVNELSTSRTARVETVQGLLASGERPPCDVFVLDEVHHFRAPLWSQLLNDYPHARVLGLTATPARGDGAALGDIMQRLVVAAQYSELTRDGYLVPCRVFRPDAPLDPNELGHAPVAAYQRWGDGGRGFVYLTRVLDAADIAAQFRDAGISCQPIDGSMPKAVRAQRWKQFIAGDLRLLSNVQVLTEGVDLPAARVVLLARRCQHHGTFLQIAGRVLRPFEGKASAILIDLTGVTHQHGLPGQDCEYSLTGEPIKAKNPPLKQCPQCGATIRAHLNPCPECGFLWVVKPPPDLKIWSMELKEVFAGEDTPKDAKAAEWNRLLALCEAKGWGIGWAKKEFEKLFPGTAIAFTKDQKRQEYDRLLAVVAAKGFNPGFAAHKYRETFGVWPRGLKA